MSCNDRCISQELVSPRQDQADTAVAAFSSNRPSICNWGEQNHSRTESWGRRRYGPVQQASQVAA
jgi:hypothetical protein